MAQTSSGPHRRRLGRSAAGKRGHEPHLGELIPTEECRKVIVHMPRGCRCGSTHLSPLDVRDLHQVIYLPTSVAPVDEHRSMGGTCLECGADVVEPIPLEFLCSAFRACVVALAAQLTGEYHLPKRTVVAVLAGPGRLVWDRNLTGLGLRSRADGHEGVAGACR